MKDEIYFLNSNGVKLCGVLSDPANDISRSIIIFCHGFTVDKGSFTITSLEEILNKHKISTFKFDFFGHGESDGDFSQITKSEIWHLKPRKNYLCGREGDGEIMAIARGKNIN